LVKLFTAKGINTPEIWTSILEHEGSVQHLDELDEMEKSLFKTAFELDQRWLVEHAADRAKFICQSQSVNLFLLGDVSKWDLHMLHWKAWESGVKSLYYCRSKSVQRTAFANSQTQTPDVKLVAEPIDYEECLACQ